MKSYRLGLYEKALPDSMSWEDKFKEAGLGGYDFIEISIDESDMRLNRLYDENLQEEIKAAQQNSQIKIESMCLSGHRKYPLGSLAKEDQDKSLDIFYRAVDFAFDLGVRMIQLAGYDVYYSEGSDETYANFIRNLRKGIAYAACRGIVCGFETMETDFMNTVAKARQVCDIIASPYCAIYPDLGNLTNASISMGHDLYEDIRSGNPLLIAAHLKDTLPGLFRNLEFGEGHVDFEQGSKVLWDSGIRRYTCEFWNLEREDYRERLIHNANTARAILDRLSEEEK